MECACYLLAVSFQSAERLTDYRQLTASKKVCYNPQLLKDNPWTILGG